MLVVGKESLEYSLVNFSGREVLLEGLKVKEGEANHRYVLSDCRLVRITTTGEEQRASGIEIAELV